ncbi:MAG: hypothetical protein VX908_02520 [Planctomycetota bacterium]|nr:hypothetical protein [Planctomycetota bacterium]
MRICITFLLALLLGVSTGCHVNRARPVKEAEATTKTPFDEVTITGSYSIGEDGSVAYNLKPRPDGDLLGKKTTQGMELEHVDGWIRSTTSRAGGSIARITSVTGPYREDPDDLEDPLLYDITIEVWAGR